MNKNSTRFGFLAFFCSYIAKYFGYMILMVCDIELPLIFGISYSLSDFICSFILIVYTAIMMKVIFFSNYTTKFQNLLNSRPDRNNMVTYCIVEGGIWVSMSFLLLITPNSASSLFIITLFSLIILVTYIVQEFNTINVTNNRKIRNIVDA